MSTPPGSEAAAIRGYSFLVALANDGAIDTDELAFIKNLALRDGVADEREPAVLSAIFSRVNQDATSAESWAAPLEFKQAYGIA